VPRVSGKALVSDLGARLVCVAEEVGELAAQVDHFVDGWLRWAASEEAGAVVPDGCAVGGEGLWLRGGRGSG
jgi:hypothetical protein